MAQLTNLQDYVADALQVYKQRGHNEESWQWLDEGLPYAIMDYYSMRDSFTKEDIMYLKDNDLFELAMWSVEIDENY